MAKETMPSTPPVEETFPLVVELAEWAQVGPAQDKRLEGTSFGDDAPARRLAEALRRRVDIREGRRGLEIASTSYVGRVDVGPLRIVIRPKLPAMPLARLLRYAYALRNVTTVEETQAPTTRHGLHDLLVAMLAAEVEELMHRGLSRRYVPVSEMLECPRGRILVEELAHEGGIRKAQLPCHHFERRVDWHLNRVLRSGLIAATYMSEDRDLRRRVNRLAEMFDDVQRKERLDSADIDRAERGLTRLTEANRPALAIIRLLHDMLGLAFTPEGEAARMPGFLFDMNAFFQRLLSRFLHDNLLNERIEDERVIRNVFAYAPDANPKRRSAPNPRPDYALFEGKTLRAFLDAKYRDTWEHGLPVEWLYQLSIYASASPARVGVLLYASMAADARDEQVDVRQPVTWSSRDPTSVILRPVPLFRLAELLDPGRTRSLAEARTRLAEELVALRTRKPGEAAKRGNA